MRGDTGSVKPGSKPYFGSVSGSENQIFGILFEKILFAYNIDTFCGSLDTEPVSWFWLADPYFLYRS